MLFSLYILAAIGWLLMALTKGYSGLTFSIGLGYIIACAFLMHWLNRQGDSLAKPSPQQIKWQDRAFFCTLPCLLFAAVIAFLLYYLIVYFFRVLYWTLWKGALWFGNKEVAAVYHQALRQNTNILDEPFEPPLIIRD